MSCYVTQSGMELTILLPQPPEDWDYGLAPARLILHYFLCFISCLFPACSSELFKGWALFLQCIIPHKPKYVWELMTPLGVNRTFWWFYHEVGKGSRMWIQHWFLRWKWEVIARFSVQPCLWLKEAELPFHFIQILGYQVKSISFLSSSLSHVSNPIL